MRQSRGCGGGGRFGNYHQIKIMQKMQVVAKEEETKEQGGVIEAKVDGSNVITVI